MRSIGVWCFECLGPVGGTDPDVGPVGLDQQALGGGSSYNLTAGSIADTMSADDFRRAAVRIGLDGCCGSLGDEIPQGAGLHAFLAEARQHVGDVGQVRTVRPDEQHPTPAVAEARVGVEEVGSAVQSDDGLPRTRTAVDDESPAGGRPDDGVLVGLDGAEHVAHAGERLLPRLAMKADWSSSAACPSSPSGLKTSSQ